MKVAYSFSFNQVRVLEELLRAFHKVFEDVTKGSVETKDGSIAWSYEEGVTIEIEEAL